MGILWNLIQFVVLSVVAIMLAVITIAITFVILVHPLIALAVALVIRYIWFKFFRYQPKCPGCETCDPQAFIDEDGEIDPGIHRLTRR